jgi:broad specificity phosphatase PhoE
MEPTRILAIRHGETAWNVDTRLQGHLDIPLNEVGLRQAEHLARDLAERERVDAIYASDLSRAHTTAQAIARAMGHTDPVWITTAGKTGSTPNRRPDITKLKSVIKDYRPRTFEQGVKEIVDNMK